MAIATNWHRLEALMVRSVREMVERGEWPTARLEP